MLTEQETKLQKEWLKNNKIKTYEVQESIRPYSGKPLRQSHYRKSKSIIESLFQSQDYATRDYGGGNTQSAGQGD